MRLIQHKKLKMKTINTPNNQNGGGNINNELDESTFGLLHT